MQLEVENSPPLSKATESQIRSAIGALRSYGPSSYAALIDDIGNYVQVAGGGVTCMIERRDIQTGKHFRAYRDEASKVFLDGTTLAFGGGEIKLAANEWFKADEAEEVFLAFFNQSALPEWIKWRDISQIFVEPTAV